ncbi:DOCK family protein [Pelomyxa schiedti]|nr:DOCK family protein [Pelomyxa schiedti]
MSSKARKHQFTSVERSSPPVCTVCSGAVFGRVMVCKVCHGTVHDMCVSTAEKRPCVESGFTTAYPTAMSSSGSSSTVNIPPPPLNDIPPPPPLPPPSSVPPPPSPPPAVPPIIPPPPTLPLSTPSNLLPPPSPPTPHNSPQQTTFVVGRRPSGASALSSSAVGALAAAVGLASSPTVSHHNTQFHQPGSFVSAQPSHFATSPNLSSSPTISSIASLASDPAPLISTALLSMPTRSGTPTNTIPSLLESPSWRQPNNFSESTYIPGSVSINTPRHPRTSYGTVRKRNATAAPRPSIQQAVITPAEEAQPSNKDGWGHFETAYFKEKEHQNSAFLFPVDDIAVTKIKRRPLPSYIKKEVLSRDSGTASNVDVFIDEYTRDYVILEHRSSSFGASRNTFSHPIDTGSDEFFSFYRKPEDKPAPVAPPAAPENTSLQAADIQKMVDATSSGLSAAFGQTEMSGSSSNISAKNSTDVEVGKPASLQESHSPGFLEKAFFPFRRSLLVELGQLKLFMGQEEVLVGTMALFNSTSGVKTSEDFHFHLKEKSSTGIPFEPLSLPTMKYALFTVDHHSRNLFIVIKLFRVFRGDADKDLQKLVNSKTAPAYLQTVHNEIRTYPATPLLPPLQPFLWTFFQVFQGEDKLVLTNLHEIESFYPLKGTADATLCEMLTNPEGLRKNKIPATGTCKVSFYNENDTSHLVLDHLLTQIEVKPSSKVKSLVRKMQHFVTPDATAQPPYTEYVNHMFIFPESALMKPNQNIQVMIQLTEAVNLNDPNSINPLKVVYPPLVSVPRSIEFLTEGFSSVIWNEKVPEFCDEIKINLPTRLNCNHKLVFTFFNISPGPTRGRPTVVGYSVQPIFGDSIIRNGSRKIPVFKDLSECQIATMEGRHKHYFSFRIETVSSLYPQDEMLALFFYKAIKRPDECLRSTSHDGSKSIAKLSVSQQLEAVGYIDQEKISPQALVLFFPTIMSTLFNIMCTWSEIASHATFLSLLKILPRIDRFLKAEKTAALLSHYVRAMLDPPQWQSTRGPLHELLVKYWTERLNVAEEFNAEVPPNTEYSWFFFEVISKSASIWAFTSGKLATDERSGRFPTDFMERISTLIKRMMEYWICVWRDKKPRPSMRTNAQSISTFISAMFPLADRGVLISVVNECLLTCDPTTDASTFAMFILHMLRTVSDYEHYIPLNMPALTPLTFDTVEGLDSLFWQRHPLVGVLLCLVQKCILHKGTNRLHGIKTLRDVLRKHALDARYNSPELQKKICSMYFPLILSAVSNKEVLNQFEDSHKHDYLISFLYVLKNCEKELLRMWWRADTEKRHTIFFELILDCIEHFQDQAAFNEVLRIAAKKSKLFMEERRHFLDSPQDPVFSRILAVWTSLLANIDICAFTAVPLVDPRSLHQATTFQLTAAGVRTLINDHGVQLFVNQGNSFCDLLSYELLRYMNSPKNATVGETALDLFYLMLWRHFEHTNDTLRMKIQALIAATKLLGYEGVKTDLLDESLLALDQKILQADQADFQQHAKEVTSRLQSHLRYNAKIATTQDPETLIDLCYKTTLSYFDSPDLMITWLDSYIVPKHQANNHLEEAAQCKILKAYLIAQYLIYDKHLNSISESDFIALSPNLDCMKLPVSDLSTSKAGGQFQSENWCLSSLTNALKEAIDFLEQANLYEACIEIYNTLGNIYKREKNYADMKEAMEQCAAMCGTMVEKEKGKEPRIFARYYRVAFFGNLIEELDRTEYIYKMPPECILATATKHISHVLQTKLPPANVALLPNKTFDATTLDPHKMYYQIVSVDPYFENASRVSLFERHFNTSSFISMQSFSDGKRNVELHEQKKKKIIYSAELPFPFVKNRLAIKMKREIIIEPIENAFELISERIDKIREQLEYNPPKLNPLQQVLQGSVVPMVNEGPLKICETFLSPEARATHRKEHIDKLSWAMATFIDFCGYATQLNHSIIDEKHVKFHQMICDHLATMRSRVTPFLSAGHRLQAVITQEDIDNKTWRLHKLLP